MDTASPVAMDTHAAVRLGRLDTAAVVISYTTCSVSLLSSLPENLLLNLLISTHTGRKLGPQVNQVRLGVGQKVRLGVEVRWARARAGTGGVKTGHGIE